MFEWFFENLEILYGIEETPPQSPRPETRPEVVRSYFPPNSPNISPSAPPNSPNSRARSHAFGSHKEFRNNLASRISNRLISIDLDMRVNTYIEKWSNSKKDVSDLEEFIQELDNILNN
jgi:hypothetical protein